MDNAKLYPRSMQEAKELGYIFAGLDDCFLNGFEFTSDTEMKWEGHIEFDLGAEGDHSDGNLGRFKVRARVAFTFERIEPAERPKPGSVPGHRVGPGLKMADEGGSRCQQPM